MRNIIPYLKIDLCTYHLTNADVVLGCDAVWTYDIILASTLESSELLLLFRFSNQHFVRISYFSMRARCHVSLILLDLIILTIFGTKYQL